MKITWETTLEQFKERYISNQDLREKVHDIRKKHGSLGSLGSVGFVDLTMACLLGETSSLYAEKTYGQKERKSTLSKNVARIIIGQGAKSVRNDIFNEIDKSKPLREIDDAFLISYFNSRRKGIKYQLSDENANSVIEVLKEIVDGYPEEGVSLKIAGNAFYKIQELIDNGVTQLILTGAPGTGKTFMSTEIANQFANIPGKSGNTKYQLVQFHPSYDYTDFIEGLRPIETDQGMEFKRVDGHFKEFCRHIISEGKEDKQYLFIIDEINRADLSKVFGELMYSLETDKRGSDHKIITQYHNLNTYDIKAGRNFEDDVFKDGFYIPENVIIIGTMNDIDRSVESMDFALRRRFHWYEVKVSKALDEAFASRNGESMFNYFSLIEDEGLHQKVRNKVSEKIMQMNDQVIGSEDYHLNEAYYISQGYFKTIPGKFQQGKNAEEIAKNILIYVWNYRLKSLLTEYVRGEPYANEFVEKCYQTLIAIKSTEHVDE